MSGVWAVTACYRPDIGVLRETLRVMGLPADRVVVVANNDDPPRQEEIPEATVIPAATAELNLARWWNEGMDYVACRDRGEHDLLVFDADSAVPAAGITRLSEVLREHGLGAACPDRLGTLPAGSVHTERQIGPVPWEVRMTGWCFMLRGEAGLRADPQFRFWYADDDMECQARLAGGTGMAGGVRGGHPEASRPLTPYQRECADTDAGRFSAKWGFSPA